MKIQIEITTKCNLSCPECPRTLTGEDRYADMPLYLFQRTLDIVQQLHVTEVELFLFGEPMACTHFSWYCGLCESMGIKVGLTTNGTYLFDDQTKTAALLRLHAAGMLTHIDISYDLYRPSAVNVLAIQKALHLFKQNLPVRFRVVVGNADQFSILQKQLPSAIPICYQRLVTFDPTNPCREACNIIGQNYGIMVDGTVLPCCMSATKFGGYGNIMDRNIKERMICERDYHVLSLANHQYYDYEICKHCAEVDFPSTIPFKL